MEGFKSTEPGTCRQWCHVAVRSAALQSRNLQARVRLVTPSAVTLGSYSM